MPGAVGRLRQPSTVFLHCGGGSLPQGIKPRLPEAGDDSAPCIGLGVALGRIP